MPMTYTTSTDRIIGDIDQEARAALVAEANRRVNMTGWRYSDALRAERATFEDRGRESYMALHAEASRIARQLGY